MPPALGQASPANKGTFRRRKSELATARDYVFCQATFAPANTTVTGSPMDYGVTSVSNEN